MIKTAIDEFLKKFYQVIIVTLVCFSISLFVLLFIQSARVSSLKGKLDTIEQKFLAEKTSEVNRALKDVIEKQNELNKISSEYESLKLEQEKKQRVIYKNVEKFIDRPVYRNVCLDDDGMSEINSAIEAYDPKQSASPLPTATKN